MCRFVRRSISRTNWGKHGSDKESDRVNIDDRVQNETYVSVLKPFPQDKAFSSDIAIIDMRSCIRDAMANAFRGNNERRVYTAGNSTALSTTPFNDNASLRQLILFCDGSLPINSVREQLAELNSSCPDAKKALLTDHSDHQELGKLVKEFNLDGVIPSYYETRQLLACIQVIESGIGYFPNSFSITITSKSAASSTEISRDKSSVLTPRQMQVMEYIFEGKSNKYIAAELSVSESTIKVHVHEAMKRLGATSRTHAAYLMGQGS